MSCDPNFSDVVLLVPCDGADGSTSFSDLSPQGNSIDVNGSAVVSNANPLFSENTLALPGGTSSSLSVNPTGALNLASATDWTVELFMNAASIGGDRILWSDRDGSDTSGLNVSADGTAQTLNVQIFGSGGVSASLPISFTSNTWHHVAVVAVGADITAYFDGVGASVGTIGALDSWFGTHFIGQELLSSTLSNVWNGLLANVRISRIARYTADFTPPTAPFPTTDCGSSVAVPDVTGLSQDDATTALVSADLVLGAVTVEYSDTVPLNLTISQSPVAGSLVAPASAVDIVLSLGPPPVSVPNVVNLSLAAATDVLGFVGLVVGALSNAFSEDVEAGSVVSQSPAGGALVAIGSPIALVISLGPEAVSVPDVIGMTSSDAADALRVARLRVGIITVDTSGIFPIGTIASQFANAGALVPSGTKINLVLSAIAPPFDVDATVISQYQQSPTLVEMVEDFAVYIDPRTNLTEFYALVWNVDTAQGFGLDVWGKIVGVSRLLRVIADDPTFGFDNASTPPPDWEPWSQGRFALSGGLGGEAVILPDDAYRILILTKALANIAATSSAAINQLLRNLFPGRGKAYVRDLGGMAMQFVFEFALTPVEYAIVSQSGAVPHPAGVSLSVSVPP